MEPKHYSKIISQNGSEQSDLPIVLTSIHDITCSNQPKMKHESLEEKPVRKNVISWTYEDDRQLSRLVSEYGHKWMFFSKYFPGKTVLQVKNRWYSNLRKEQRKQKSLVQPTKTRKYYLSTKNTNNTFPQKIDNFWDVHLQDESILKDCFDIYLEMSI